MPITRRDYLPMGLRLFLLIEGVAMLILVAVMMAVDDGVGTTTMVAVIVILLLLQVSLLFMHGFITLRHDSVRVGFWPIFRRTFHYPEIEDVASVQVDALRDYRGWGLRGRSRDEQGMLLGGGSPHGVRLTLVDGRRYVVTSREPVNDLVATIDARVR